MLQSEVFKTIEAWKLPHRLLGQRGMGTGQLPLEGSPYSLLRWNSKPKTGTWIMLYLGAAEVVCAGIGVNGACGAACGAACTGRKEQRWGTIRLAASGTHD